MTGTLYLIRVFEDRINQTGVYDVTFEPADAPTTEPLRVNRFAEAQMLAEFLERDPERGAANARGIIQALDRGERVALRGLEISEEKLRTLLQRAA